MKHSRISLRDVSIKKKLTIIILLTCSVALLLACGLFMVYDFLHLRDEMRHRIAMLAGVVEANSRASLSFQDRNSAEETLRTLGAEERIVCAAIYGPDGGLFARYTRSDAAGEAPPPRPQQDGTRFAGGRLIRFSPIVLDQQRIGTLFLSSNLEELHTSVRVEVAIALSLMVGALLVALLLSSRLQRVITEPIAHLALTAKVVATEKNFSLRAVKRGGDDVGVPLEGPEDDASARSAASPDREPGGAGRGLRSR